MRDHYRGFSHPVLVELPVEPTVDLFSEMDAIADKLRSAPQHIASDDQIAFRQLQRTRLPHLSREEFLDLFQLWLDHDRAQQEVKESERRERVAKLWAELDALISERAALPLPQQTAVTEKIATLGREIAAVITPNSPPSLASWG